MRAEAETLGRLGIGQSAICRQFDYVDPTRVVAGKRRIVLYASRFAVPAAIPLPAVCPHTGGPGMSKQVPWDVIPENTGVVLPEQLYKLEIDNMGGDGERRWQIHDQGHVQGARAGGSERAVVL